MQSTSPFYPYCLEVFKQSSLFSGLGDEQLATFLQDFRRETWKPHAPIEIQTHERFFVVLKGRVELVRTDYSTGRDLTIFLLNPGDAFDLIPLLDGEPHDLRILAWEQVDLLSVPIISAREWIQTHPAFNQRFLPYLGHQMRALEALATDLAFHNTITRLGRLLTHHLLPNHQPLMTNMQPLHLLHGLSHEALARMIGSVRVVVSRHIQHWKKNGAVSTSRKHLVIRDLKALETNCNEIEAFHQLKK